MSALTVLCNPNPELRVLSEALSDEDILLPHTQKLIDDMIVTMQVEDGVGLAAPQVGAHLRIIIAETPHGNEAFINPVITSRSVRLVPSTEGCLSVPGMSGTVKRNSSVKVTAKNRLGETVDIKANGLLAIIFQHEIDHLDGILFIDRADKVYTDAKSRL
ncbi:TPA: peptide deformylase [Candidatus Uhrbacteria bacterium]|nr:peptide deformylase [Candidatus Uhrbacteria bacterium]